MIAFGSDDVSTGRERQRYIDDGRISNRRPVFATAFTGGPLTADQLADRGYHYAAQCKRGKLEPWSVMPREY